MVVIAAIHVAAVFTESINWDEFVLLKRARQSLQTGEVIAGGRPGLGTLALMPFAAHCRNAVDALVQARLLWQVIVFGSVAAFGLLLRAALPNSPHRGLAVLVGLSLWILSPPVLRFSVQVRTDQPAILFGLLGGMALIQSRTRLAWAIAAGLCFGIGFLFSQKLLYIGVLVVILASGQLLLLREWSPRRELLRVVLTSATFLLAVLVYRALAAYLLGRPPAIPLAGALSMFPAYREMFAWYFFQQEVAALLPQFLVLALLLYFTLDWLDGHRERGRELLVAWGLLGAGIAILIFHAGRLPYFFMVLCLFPAAIGALLVPAAAERWRRAGTRRAALAIFWFPVVALATREAALLSIDTQRIQRETLAFVDGNFSAAAIGFQDHGVLACRSAPQPFPIRFGPQVRATFFGEGAEARRDVFLQEFRKQPVTFLIPPFLFYPPEIRSFFFTRYVPYAPAVFVPGAIIEGGPGWTTGFEAVVAGSYTWHSTAGDDLEIDGRRVEPGGSLYLEGGAHRLTLPAGGEGRITLTLRDAPGDSVAEFYREF
jgi:hypothetical protein